MAEGACAGTFLAIEESEKKDTESSDRKVTKT